MNKETKTTDYEMIWGVPEPETLGGKVPDDYCQIKHKLCGTWDDGKCWSETGCLDDKE